MSAGEERQQQALHECLQRVREAYAADDLAACTLNLDAACAIDSEAAEIMRWQARLAWRRSDWDALSEAAQAYLELRPVDREMAQLLARALSNSKQWIAAGAAWRRVCELRPEWPEAWLQLARAQLRAELPHAAARTALRLNGLAGTDALVARCRLALERGQFAEAADHFAHLAAEAPERAGEELSSHEKRGDIRAAAVAALGFARGRSDDAREKMAQAIGGELLPRAVASEKRGRMLDSHLDYAVLAEIAPDDMLAKSGMKRTLHALHEAAREYLNAGDRKRAQKAYVQILYCQPADTRALNALGQIAMADQDWRRAAEFWSAQLAAAPGDPKAQLQLARALDRAQEFSSAFAAWRLVLAGEENNGEAQLALAKLPARIVKAGREAAEAKRHVDAVAIFLEVPGDCAERADAMRRLEQAARHLRREMRAAYKARRFERVVRLGRAAAAAAPDNDDIQRLLAQAAMRTHDFAIAADAWRRVMALSPQAAGTAALQLARCHLRLGAFADGRAVLDGLLAREPDNQEARVLAGEFDAAAALRA